MQSIRWPPVTAAGPPMARHPGGPPARTQAMEELPPGASYTIRVGASWDFAAREGLRTSPVHAERDRAGHSDDESARDRPRHRRCDDFSAGTAMLGG